MAQKMDAALAPHTALFQRAVIDVLPDVSTHRLTRLFAEEEPRAVMTRFTLTLRSPVVYELFEQTFAQRQNASLGSLAVAYSQLHTGAVDVAGLELCGLRNSQPAAIDGHQEHPVARLSGRSQDRFDLAARIDFGAPGGALHVRDRCH